MVFIRGMMNETDQQGLMPDYHSQLDAIFKFIKVE